MGQGGVTGAYTPPPAPPTSMQTQKRLPVTLPTQPSQSDIPRQPYPASFNSSVSGQYRLSHPPMPPRAPNYAAGETGAAPQGFPQQGVANRPPQQTPVSGLYNSHSLGPPPVSNDLVGDGSLQNGSYFPGVGDGASPNAAPMHMPYGSQANGPSGPMTAPPQYSQMPMQGRYPPMSQQQPPPGPGMQPPPSSQQQQYVPQNTGLPQNRMPAAPMPATAPAQSRRLDPDHMPSPVCIDMLFLFLFCIYFYTFS